MRCILKGNTNERKLIAKDSYPISAIKKVKKFLNEIIMSSRLAKMKTFNDIKCWQRWREIGPVTHSLPIWWKDKWYSHLGGGRCAICLCLGKYKMHKAYDTATLPLNT